ncbi:MAG: DUF3035 domain-containing protein, partial [Rickettsiales bacterium]
YSAFPIILTTCSLLAVTACGGSSVKETLGLGRKAPDEFRVVSRPPLSVPPQFNLRPPSASAESPSIIPADKQAESIITGNPLEKNNDLRNGEVDTAVMPVDSTSLPSATSEKKADSESQFLKNIGADKADPNVRNELMQKRIAIQEKNENESWWNAFSTTSKEKATLVNAKEEAKRIQTNKAENKPITEGETPEIKDKDRGLIGKIFGW